MKKYNLSEIMHKAWKLYRKGVSSFAEALHRAWNSAKAQPINAQRIEEAQQAAGITEPVETCLVGSGSFHIGKAQRLENVGATGVDSVDDFDADAGILGRFHNSHEDPSFLFSCTRIPKIKKDTPWLTCPDKWGWRYCMAAAE